MKFVLSFIAIRFELLRRFWHNREILKEKKGIIGTDEICRDDVGGAIFCCESSDRIEDTRIISKKLIRNCYGILVNQSSVYVMINRPGSKIGEMRDEYILKLSLNDLEEEEKIENRFFNQSHSLSKSSKGYIVTSTGLDLILEVDEQGKVLWDYWLTDHGYDLTPLGHTRKINKNLDHRMQDYPTLNQTTHVIGAEYLNEEHVLAVLCHQGEIIRIDRSTDENEMVLRNLKCPHHFHTNDLRRRKDINRRYIISNTLANKVLLLDGKFNVTKEIGDYINLDWVQDAIYTSRDTILLADANNNRLVEMDFEGRFISSWNYDKSFRIFQIYEY